MKVEENEVSFRDRAPIITEEGKRRWIYAWKPTGKYYNARTILSIFYLVFFFAAPFIKINGNPLLQLNVVEGKFSIFGMLFWPQDFFIFAVGLITFIVFIYLFTMIFGRIFCGWICPQTVFLEMVYRRIEWAIEGNPNKQKMLNRGPWTTEKIWKKSLKHVIFFGIAFLIANTFLAYIIGVEDLFKIISEPVSQHVVGLVSLLIFTFVFYSVFAFVREIVCTIICPYGRMQGVLLDPNSIIVAYDYQRGEPRGKGKRPSMQGLGDCIDCSQCVVVCPTGIDIRNGTQLECINCTACIDACNTVMRKVGLPENLIKYASENQIRDKKPFQFDTRMKVYSFILLFLIGSMSFMLATRNDVGVTLMRAPGMLYQEVGTDSLSNLYNMAMTNKKNVEIEVELRIESPVGGTLKIIGDRKMISPAGGQDESTFFIVLPKSVIKSRETKVTIGLYQDNRKIETISTNFLGYTE